MRTSTLLVSAAVLALTACSSNDASKGGAGGKTGGTFIYSAIGDAVDIFPPFIQEQNGRMVVDLVFDRLADIGPGLATVGDREFTPRLAKSWDWAPDSLSIAFHVDPRARWHDGKPVTASDVRYSFRVFADPKTGSPTTSLLGNIDSVSVRDSLTAVVWYKKHLPEEFFTFVYQIWIMPEHVYGSIPADQLHTSPQTKQLIGSGPYRFVRWQPGVRLDLIADTANYRGRPNLDRIVMSPIADPNAGVTQVLTGQTDFMQAFPADQANKLDSSKIARRIDIPIRAYAWLGFNPVPRKQKTGSHPVFGDVRVRRALSMAVDRGAMLQNVFGPTGRIGRGPFPAVVGYADTTLKLPPYDTVAAKALLDSAGWRVGANGIRVKNGVPLKFTMTTTTTSLFRRRYAVLLQDAFKRVGAQTDIDAVDPPTFQNARLSNGDFDAIIGTFAPDPDLGGAIQTWGSGAIGSTNWLRYSSKSVDALLDSAISAFDPAKSKSYSSRAFQQIVNDAPAIWLYDITFVDAVNRRIQMVEPVLPDFWMQIPQWSIPADKRIDRDRIGLTQSKP
ncbi:MAG TPA: peptide ABC transporter substrate-binding protein [Gemmatimonadaceae bacterium]|jgi:peptide/nickel transport system substrate-binding protein|nr:peptide ABC transporter substrate-binding protein [Gemmatimonadaceae bacterium]